MKVLAINDISCVGKCSLTVGLPIISANGITCDVLPTAILSTHTGGFTAYTFRDLSDDIPAMIAHWESLNLKYDVIYSGYLGSISQIEMVKSAKEKLLKKGGIMIVDPVLGDGGQLYKHFDLNFVEKMADLCKIADYILPNETEACLLTGYNYNNLKTENDFIEVLNKLSTLCSRCAITGAQLDEKCVIFYKGIKGIQKYSTDIVDGAFHGTGDVFASLFTACIAKGICQEDAIKLSADFTYDSVLQTKKDDTDRKYGINFESQFVKHLPIINEYISKKNY